MRKSLAVALLKGCAWGKALVEAGGYAPMKNADFTDVSLPIPKNAAGNPMECNWAVAEIANYDAADYAALVAAYC